MISLSTVSDSGRWQRKTISLICTEFLLQMFLSVSKQLLVLCIRGHNIFSSVKKNTVTTSCLHPMFWQRPSFREASVVILLKLIELLWILHDIALLGSPGKNLSTQFFFSWRYFLTRSFAEPKLSSQFSYLFEIMCCGYPWVGIAFMGQFFNIRRHWER